MKYSILTLTLVLVTLGCSKKEELVGSFSVDSVEASIESGLTIISGMADDQVGSTYALDTKEQSPWSAIADIIFIPKAYAATCSRAYYQSCVGGVKSQSYNACEVSSTSRTISGDVELQYSQSDCSLSTTGDTVERLYNIEITGSRGGVISHSSDTLADYNSNSYGGGGKITKTSTGWDLEVLGRHTQFTYNNKTFFDVSIRTLSPIGISGSLSRSSRVVDGGTLEVNHNLAEFTSEISPNNLQWSGSCCHPISGTLDIVYSGSKSGTASVTFNGCGSATVDDGGQQSDIELSYCE